MTIIRKIIFKSFQSIKDLNKRRTTTFLNGKAPYGSDGNSPKINL